MKVKHGNIWSILIFVRGNYFSFSIFILFLSIRFKENGELLRNVFESASKVQFS